MQKITKVFIAIILSLIVSQTVCAQQPALYMPIEFKRAFDNGTRNPDGTVSDKYFQNRSIYDIKAKVDPTTRKVTASATITYFNESPHLLPSIQFHAYKDLYEEGMEISKLIVEGKEINLKSNKSIDKSSTYYLVTLENPLKPGASITLEMDWSITIPATVDRDGAYDETSMLVAYWYPEIAVYDDIYGWDLIDFDGTAEFYHDVSSFKVEIEMPDNFVIWASDAPVNANEIYPKKILDRLAAAQATGDKVVIIDKKDVKKGLKMNSNIWRYEVDSFPDFTFAFSDHYLWEAATYTDQFGSFFINSAYPAKNEVFGLVVDIEKDVLASFHNDFPKYPFPFKHFVAFNGETGGGMEFAGMCNDQARFDYTAEGVRYSDYEANLLLTQHEMMHMYFPFLMGINEKRFAWMDEGMAEFSEDYFTGVNLESYKDRSRFATSDNSPIMAQTYTIPLSYGINTYDNSSMSYHALLHLLGKDTFDKCIKGYMDRWKYKHPTPYDFFHTFNDLSGQDLNWFWKAWYFDWGYPDVAIKTFENGKLTIENVGGYPIAVEIVVTYDDDTSESSMTSPAVWKDKSTFQTEIKSTKSIKSIELKTMNGPDAIGENNKWLAE